MHRISLTERHRPRTLDAVVGQGPTVWALKSFVEVPYSGAFLFCGPTGTGKTSAASALAADLGVSVVDGAFGGYFRLDSGQQTADSVRDVLRLIRSTPMVGSGWRLVQVEEADRMGSEAVRNLWLSAVEDLPPRCVVVFTSNHPDKLEQRLIDRCERLDFGADPDLLAQDAQALIDSVWQAETGRSDSPRLADLRGVVLNGQISFRRVVAALEPLLRSVPRLAPTPLPAPTRHDLLGRPLRPVGSPRETVPVPDRHPDRAPVEDTPFALTARSNRPTRHPLFDGQDAASIRARAALWKVGIPS